MHAAYGDYVATVAAFPRRWYPFQRILADIGANRVNMLYLGSTTALYNGACSQAGLPPIPSIMGSLVLFGGQGTGRYVGCTSTTQWVPIGDKYFYLDVYWCDYHSSTNQQ